MNDNQDIPPEGIEIKSIEDLVENVAQISQQEYESIRQRALDEAKTRKHAWVQKGRGMLRCTSCPFPHTAYIDPHLRLIGLDDQGNPIFDKQ